MTMPAMFRTFLSHLCVLVLTMAVLTGCVTSPLSIAQRHNEGLSPGDTGYMTVRGDCENFKDDNGTDGLDTNDGDGDNYCRACMQANDIFVAPLPSDMV